MAVDSRGGLDGGPDGGLDGCSVAANKNTGGVQGCHPRHQAKAGEGHRYGGLKPLVLVREGSRPLRLELPKLQHCAQCSPRLLLKEAPNATWNPPRVWDPF